MDRISESVQPCTTEITGWPVDKEKNRILLNLSEATSMKGDRRNLLSLSDSYHVHVLIVTTAL